MRSTLLHLTCLRSMNASCRVSPWNPGTGSELANTVPKKKKKEEEKQDCKIYKGLTAKLISTHYKCIIIFTRNHSK